MIRLLLVIVFTITVVPGVYIMTIMVPARYNFKSHFSAWSVSCMIQMLVMVGNVGIILLSSQRRKHFVIKNKN